MKSNVYRLPRIPLTSLAIHAPTPTRFAAGFTLRSSIFFRPRREPARRLHPNTHYIVYKLLNSNQELLVQETSSLKCDPYAFFDNTLSTQ